MYLPFLNGLYSVAPGLLQTSKIAAENDRKVFQVDDDYPRYMANKQNCRHEDIGKYFVTHDFAASAEKEVNRFIAGKVVAEHPAVFELRADGGQHLLQNNLTGTTLRWRDDWLQAADSPYLSLFDALCSQVQEDVAVCMVAGDTNYLAALHLSSPNYWSPANKIGRDFAAIHEIVPGMERMRPHFQDMLRSVVQKGPFTRFAWGLSTDDRLNHHPEPPAGVDPQHWWGRDFGPGCPVFIRTERQSIVGFPGFDSFLFTIRTYFYPVQALDTEQKKLLYSAITSMSEESREYKGLKGHEGFFREMLVG